MLSGQLIRSGNLHDVTPLGGVGYPVYAAAAQIRTAVAKQLGQDYADFLAIPQFDSRGETIDWYAAMEGDVVPWEAASASERNFMRQRISDICARIEGHAQQIQTAPKSNDQLVFGKLLELCTRIPDDSHIYLIGGKPLVTFWGFVRAGADTATHVLADLPAAPVSAPVQQAASEAAVPVATARRRSWWWLLGLLLLLVLLWFGLRSCVTPAALPGFLQGIVHPEEPTQATPRTDGQLIENGTVVGPGGNTTVAPGTGTAVVPGTDGDTVNGTKAVTPDQAMPDQNAAGQSAPDQNAPDENAQKPDESDQGQKTSPDADKATDADKNKDAGQPQDQNKPDANAQPPQQQQPANQPAGDQNNGAQQPPSIKPIAIPDDASAKGDPSFMDGDWRSKTGLVAKNAKGPVTIDYKFDKAGKGTTTLHLQNGVTCSGPSQASTSKGKVIVQDQGSLSCSNGQSFTGAKVECAKNASGQTGCVGHYPNGQTFDIILGR